MPSATDTRNGARLLPRVDDELLRCPTTGQALHLSGDGSLVSADGALAYPVLDGAPVLINERRSTFKISDYLRDPGWAPTASDVGPVFERLDRWLPSLTLNRGTEENLTRLGQLLWAQSGEYERPRVLIVGAGSGGVGAEVLANDPRIECVETDITPGPRIRVICDAHDLPFASGAFDAVICQAVLEHVLDPTRVVEEIHRVLAPRGLVYSEVPFMQQVHGGAFDVTRFSLLGHRRLYRFFDEITSGAQGGPGMALGWSLWYLMRTMAGGRTGRGAAFLLARVLFFWLKYLDLLIGNRAAAVDAASGTFFLGRRRDDSVSDEAILSGYRGAGSCRPS